MFKILKNEVFFFLNYFLGKLHFNEVYIKKKVYLWSFSTSDVEKSDWY